MLVISAQKISVDSSASNYLICPTTYTAKSSFLCRCKLHWGQILGCWEVVLDRDLLKGPCLDPLQCLHLRPRIQ